MFGQAFGVSVLAFFVSPLWAQLSVAETLRVCEVTPETLAIAECVNTGFDQMILSIEGNVFGRLELESRGDALADAKGAKQDLLNQLRDPEQSADYESLLADLQAASSSVEQAQTSYQQYIVEVQEGLLEHLTESQQIKFGRAIRSGVQGLPPEYRVLDWDSRQITHLLRAIRMVDSGAVAQHPLIDQAEANFDVQYARQMLLVHIDSLEADLSAL